LKHLPSIDTSRSLSLTVGFEYKKDDGSVLNLSGAEVSIVHIADVRWQGGGVFYNILPFYKQIDSNALSILQGSNELEKTKLAGRLAEQVEEYDKVGTVNSDGVVKFDDLQKGLYLVVQTKADGISKKYEKFSPFIIAVPLMKDGVWNYGVLSYPKTAVKRIESPSGGSSDGTTSSASTIQTGDIDSVYMIGAMFIALLLLLIIFVVWRRRVSSKNE
jgi:LPXTG-motif cell wall-anchored protein